jgi:hypothetical protein
MQFKHYRHVPTFLICLAAVGLTGCMSKDIEMTDQQKRMQRCDQYVDMARESCLRGENVTIEDYKEEYRGFERDIQARMKAENEAIQKAVAAQEKIKAEKLKEALKEAEEKAKKAEEQKQ